MILGYPHSIFHVMITLPILYFFPTPPPFIKTDASPMECPPIKNEAPHLKNKPIHRKVKPLSRKLFLQKKPEKSETCVSIIKQHWKKMAEIPQECNFLTWSIQKYVKKTETVF